MKNRTVVPYVPLDEAALHFVLNPKNSPHQLQHLKRRFGKKTAREAIAKARKTANMVGL